MKNAALLTVAGFALRALGMVFRVFVAARLGPEGMGLYQLILSVYMVFVSLASAGINVASTRLGAQCLTRGRGMAPTLRSLAATAAVLGTAAMLAQLALADPLARFALHDSRAELGLCTLAPSLPFIAAAGALRGCFWRGEGWNRISLPNWWSRPCGWPWPHWRW
ncbi:MAG: oligosaccharide flippase family protein [Subdoligranulum sp.]